MLYIIISILLALVVAVFAVQNSMALELSFLHWSFPTNLVVILIFAVLIGIIIAGIWGLKIKTKSYLKTRKLQDEINRLNEENATLKQTLGNYIPKTEVKIDKNISSSNASDSEHIAAKERLVQAINNESNQNN